MKSVKHVTDGRRSSKRPKDRGTALPATRDESSAAFLDAIVDLVKPLLAPVSLRIIVAYLRGQIGVGVVELEAYDELGIRIGGEGREESMGTNDDGHDCVFHEGRDLCLTVGGALLLVTYTNEGMEDAWIADARVLSSAEVVAMFGANAVPKLLAEIANVVEGHDRGRSATRAAASERTRGLRALADLAELSGEEVAPNDLQALALLAQMVARKSPAPAPAPAVNWDDEGVFEACNLAVPMMACTLDASHRDP